MAKDLSLELPIRPATARGSTSPSLTTKDVIALCSKGKSMKLGMRNEGYIGCKGSGFKGTRTRKNLTSDQRLAVYLYLRDRIENGQLKYGSFGEVAEHFSLNPETVSGIWKRAQTSFANGAIAPDFSTKMSNCGRKRKDLHLERAVGVPLPSHTNLRSFACALKVSKSTLHRRFQEGLLCSHLNAIKPRLTPKNKLERLQWCLSMIHPNTLTSATPKFIDMHDYVHIDEEWFYLTRVAEKYYLLSHEDEPHRECQSKRFITKVMFAATVSRPILDEEGNEIFDGKIGIFPYCEWVEAKQNSKNRPKGTLELQPIVVTRDVSRETLIERVLPAIRSRWPQDGTRCRTIFVQQDNAKSHIKEYDGEFAESAFQGGWDIQMTCQPPNSPDTNILNLGFFQAIQSLQHEKGASNVAELIAAVEEAFRDFPASKINDNFLTLQATLLEIVEHDGSNKFKMPHMSKGKLRRAGLLPTHLTCNPDLVKKCQEMIQGTRDVGEKDTKLPSAQASKDILVKTLKVTFEKYEKIKGTLLEYVQKIETDGPSPSRSGMFGVKQEQLVTWYVTELNKQAVFSSFEEISEERRLVRSIIDHLLVKEKALVVLGCGSCSVVEQAGNLRNELGKENAPPQPDADFKAKQDRILAMNPDFLYGCEPSLE